MQIRECFFYKYGPEELFEFVRNKLKAEDRYDRAEWNKKDVVKKCKVPTEVNSMITAVRQLKNSRLVHVIVNQNKVVKSLVLRYKHHGAAFFVEYEIPNGLSERWQYKIRYIGNLSPYFTKDSLLEGEYYETVRQHYREALYDFYGEDYFDDEEDTQDGLNSSDEAADLLMAEKDTWDDADGNEYEASDDENENSSDIHRARKIKGIQFDKKLLMGVTSEETAVFCKIMRQKLEYIERFLGGEVRAAGKTLRFVRRRNGKQAIKYRVGKRRFSMLLNGSILTCIGLSTHDRQIQDIENFKYKQAGMVYYETDEFLNRIETYDKDCRLPLSRFLMMPRHYVLSEDQEEILSGKRDSLNMSIVGNAGAGKSLVGMKWIADECSKEFNNCLYLTMSNNLVYALREQFEVEIAEKSLSSCNVSSIGSFIHDRMKLAYPVLPDKSFLDSKESFEVFKRFWCKKVSEDQGTVMEYWRAIHGYLKGALPHELKLKGKLKVPECIDEEEYVRLRRMAGEKNYLPYDEAYRIYKKYQEYLGFAHLYDDNDLAKMLISTNKWKKEGYSSAFLDECQDLTQVQLMALLCQLRGTRSKVFSSDRCQMVQPVWFREGSMRTLANEMDKAQGKKVDPQGIRAHFLHYNFRSTRRIIDFQNALVSFFRKGSVLSLKQMEMLEIEAPAVARTGIRPVWIRCSETNRKCLTEGLWERITGLDLQLIVSNRNLPTITNFGTGAKLGVDVVECKGMEYPAVLLYNVMKDMQRDLVMAWKYFYVGATRSSDVLIIYDEMTELDASVRDFFRQAVASGVMDECMELTDARPGFEETWSEYIEKQVLRPMTAEERLMTAGTAMNYEQYKLALGIYTQLMPGTEIAAYCQGKVYEQEKRYRKAINIYANLSEDWQDKGRNRKNSIDGIIKASDVEKADYLAAMVLGNSKRADFVDYARQGYLEKYGGDGDFQDMFWEAINTYDFATPMVLQWMDCADDAIGDKMEELYMAMDEALVIDAIDLGDDAVDQSKIELEERENIDEGSEGVADDDIEEAVRDDR